MPDDSNGIYSVPAGTIVSTGDTILPSQHNPWANDSASAISNRFSKDGRAPATGNWNINSFRLTNVGAPVSGGDAVNKTYADAISSSIATKLDILQPYVDVASATTTDIGAAASQNVRITGTTTITGLGTVAAGTFRRVRFAAALTLTHNATSLILPGSANVTTAAGDVFDFVSEGSGNWRCVDYTLANGRALVVSDNITLVAAVSAASQTAINFTGIPSGTNRISVHYSLLSTNGTGNWSLNLGDAGGLEFAGYSSTVTTQGGSTTGSSGNFITANAVVATSTFTGTITLQRVSGNTWMASGILSDTANATVRISSGVKTLSDTLTQLSVTTGGGTDTFDSGYVAITYER